MLLGGAALLLAAEALKVTSPTPRLIGERFAAPLKLGMRVLGGLLFARGALVLAFHAFPTVIALGIALTLAPWALKRVHWLNGLTWRAMCTSSIQSVCRVCWRFVAASRWC